MQIVDAPDSALRDVLAYMEANFDKSVRLAELAEMSALSVSRFATVFRQRIGLSPYKYLCRVRVRRAQLLLLAGVPGAVASGAATGAGTGAVENEGGATKAAGRPARPAVVRPTRPRRRASAHRRPARAACAGVAFTAHAFTPVRLRGAASAGPAAYSSATAAMTSSALTGRGSAR